MLSLLSVQHIGTVFGNSKCIKRLKLLIWKVVWEILPTKVRIADRIGRSGVGADDVTCSFMW